MTNDPTSSFIAELRAKHNTAMAESATRVLQNRNRTVSRIALIAAMIGPAIFVQQIFKTPTSLTCYSAACWFAVSFNGTSTIVTYEALRRAGHSWPKSFPLAEKLRRLAIGIVSLLTGLVFYDEIHLAHGLSLAAAGILVASIAVLVTFGIYSAKQMQVAAVADALSGGTV